MEPRPCYLPKTTARKQVGIQRRKRPRKTQLRYLPYYSSLLCLYLSSYHHPTNAQYDCDYYGDTCRFNWQLDGFCDNQEDPATGCQGADCWDCDPCQAWSYSCKACLRQGCYWCPGDALCRSQPLEASFWTDQHPTRVTSCPTAEDWLATCDAPEDADNVFGDPYYSGMQWMYDLINVESVWREGITGKGVKVRVNDDGIDPFHQEFIVNFDEANSCDQKYPQDAKVNIRGTALASIVGADANGACAVGIAPDAKISSCNVYSDAGAAFVFSKQLPTKADISINAWNVNPNNQACQYLPTSTRQSSEETCPFDTEHTSSPCRFCEASSSTGTLINTPECQQAIQYYCTWYYELACLDYLDRFVTCQYSGMDATTLDVLVTNIVNGRNGKGVIFVFGSGDSQELGGDANMDGFVHSRFTIAVGAVKKNGQWAHYSTKGAPILVSAPGGDYEYVSNNIVARPGGQCRDAGFGTAYAVPVVAGVVALMLQVNPELGWRDVQAILVNTAQFVEDPEGEWTTNAAGYAHSYKYGFGIVDAAAAVAAARDWVNFRLEEQVTVETDKQQIIADNANNVTVSTVEVQFLNTFFRTESIVVYLDLTHASRGDLKITLKSPTGTESLLAPAKRPENTVLTEDGETDSHLWKFTTVRHFWEYPGGEWELRIVDERPGVLRRCVDFPWEYTYTMGEGGATETMTCRDFDVVSSCTNEQEVDPVLFTQQFEGRTMFDSCCACGGGENRNNITGVLKSWKMVVYGHVAAEGESTELVYIEESTCKFSNDTCPEAWQFDHVCDDTLLNEECIGGDCFDCDVCQAFSYDCAACVDAGCNYCPGDGICMSVVLDDSFWNIYPDKNFSCTTSADWMTTCESRAANSFPDPLYDAMYWAYETINVEPAWNKNVDGSGIHIRINDDGVAEHPEFEGKYDIQNSCEEYLPRDPDIDTHGTAVASIAAGNTNNECAVGIAPGAKISSCVGPDRLDDAVWMLVEKLTTVHVSVNSWGPNVCKLNPSASRRRLQECIFASDHPDSPCEACGDFSTLSDACELAVSKYCSKHYADDEVACAEYLDLWVSCEYHSLPLDAHESFVQGITRGRNGRGVIFVFSSGNTNEVGADTNFNGFVNTRFTIAVGAIGKDKKHASYSTTGAAVFVSAPGGDTASVSSNIVAKPGGGCHDIYYGTSFAAPVVAGAIALLLQLKPDLGWRDVQGIIALESQIFDSDSPSWTTNAAGYKHSYEYGFGVVDVDAYLNRASVWKHFGKEEQLMNQTKTINLAIPDSSQKITTSILTIPERLAKNFVTESVVVYLDVENPSRGDLLIVLTSPGGTDTILHPGERPENTQLEGGDDDFKRWKLLSLRTWGEFPIGEWTLSIQDRSPGIYGTCVDLPWERLYQKRDGINETLTCEDFAHVTDCNDVNQVNPEVLSLRYQNLTLLDSCCHCGGGQNSTELTPRLRSWKLVVYGHIITSQQDLIAPSSRPQNDNGGSGTNSEGTTNDEGETDAGGTDFWSEGNDGTPGTVWNDRGNSGVFAGGGGTAWWGAGWRGNKEGNAYGGDDDDATSSARRFPPLDAFCVSIALVSWRLALQGTP